MSVETETIVIKLLEELKSEAKETRKDLTDLKVGQARLDVTVQNLQAGQDAINAKLNTQNTWLLSLLTGLMLESLIVTRID